jgi:hypothetical protein
MTIESDTQLACCTLSRVDHVDTHVLRTTRTPQMWAREILENTSVAMRARLTAGWTMLGLRLRRSSAHSIAGWPITRDDAEYVRLQGDSRIGLAGQLVTRVVDGGVVFATFVQLGNPVARAVGARVLPTHLAIVESLGRGAAERTR